MFDSWKLDRRDIFTLAGGLAAGLSLRADSTLPCTIRALRPRQSLSFAVRRYDNIVVAHEGISGREGAVGVAALLLGPVARALQR